MKRVPFVLIVLGLLVAACTPGAAPTGPGAAVPTLGPAPAAPTEAAPTEAEAMPTPAEAVSPIATEMPPAAEGAVTLNIICRCVADGANANTVRWIREYVIPTFTEQMAGQGQNVTVNLVEFGGSDEQLRQQYALDLRVGQGSDVMAFDGFWVPEFVDAELLRPLNEIAGAEADNWEGWNVIPENIQALLSYQGQRYGIPAGTDARAIWYRTDIFEQAGLPTDWQPASWDELLEAARTIKEALPDVVPLQINAGTAMGEATTLQGWYMVLLGTGQNVYNFETNKYMLQRQPIVDALTFYQTVYIDEELGDARLQLLPDGRQRSFLDFRDGRIAMLVEGDFFWRSVLAAGDTALENRDELVNWAMMPAQSPGQGINGQDFVTASGGTGYVINPNTAHPQEAWALLSLMFSVDSLNWLQEIEPRIRARTDVPVPGDPVMTAIAQDLLPLTTIRPADPNYPQVSQAIQLMTEQVVSGESTPEEAADNYIAEVTALVGEEMVETSE